MKRLATLGVFACAILVWNCFYGSVMQEPLAEVLQPTHLSGSTMNASVGVLGNPTMQTTQISANLTKPRSELSPAPSNVKVNATKSGPAAAPNRTDLSIKSAIRAKHGICPRLEPMYVPVDFQCADPSKFIRLGNTHGMPPGVVNQLVSDPAEPACWDRNNACAPFVCVQTCLTLNDFNLLRRRWEPLPAGSTKVMVFQYGKVASTSIVQGLKLHSRIAAAHVHSPEQARLWMTGKSTGISFAQQGFALSQEWSLQPGDKCFVITAARSHFSRDASEYFENFMEPLHPYGFHPRGKQRSHDSPPGPGEERWTPQTVIALGASNASVLVEDFLAQHRIVTDYYSTWFSNVFQKATGIDILSVPFDYEKKYSFIPGPQCSGIALRFEDATEWEGILRQFLPDFRMRAANRGGRKWYSEAYDNFKKKLVYNEAEERLMCATETQRHFYNEPGSRCFQRNFSS